MPDEYGDQPCADCGDVMSETLKSGPGYGVWRCEKCHNIAICGCEICIKEGGHDNG